MTSNVEAIRSLCGVTAGGFDNLSAFPEIYLKSGEPKNARFSAHVYKKSAGIRPAMGE